MSSRAVVAKRYAKALFEVAQEKGIVDQVREELKGIVDTLHADADFSKFLLHPNINASDKLSVVGNVFANVSDTVSSVIHVLVNNGREAQIEELYQYYVQIANAATGSADAVVTTPQPLTEAEAAQVAAQFGQMIGKQIRITNVVDPSLLGGLSVRIGDRLYDGSLSSKLAKLEKSLNAVKA